MCLKNSQRSFFKVLVGRRTTKKKKGMFTTAYFSERKSSRFTQER